jgi:DNA-binding transcriptional LysR family regulator
MTELRNFDLNLLLAFKLLVEESSVSRAAEKLFVSQPAMSHILRKLRRQLDDPILVKTSAGMAPTPRAQALLEPIAGILRGVERVLRTPDQFSPADSQRRFVIATSDYVEFTLLPKLTEAINKRAPNIEIHVRHPINKRPETAIEEGEIDLVIGFDAIFNLPSYFCHQKLFSDKIVCIARQEHPNISGNEMSFEQFIASRHMLISRRETGTGLIDDYLEERGLVRKTSLVVPNFLSAPWIVANSDLVLSLPLRIAEQFARLAPLKIFPVPIDLPTYDLIMIWRPQQEKEPDHQWLRGEILEICRDFEG